MHQRPPHDGFGGPARHHGAPPHGHAGVPPLAPQWVDVRGSRLAFGLPLGAAYPALFSAGAVRVAELAGLVGGDATVAWWLAIGSPLVLGTLVLLLPGLLAAQGVAIDADGVTLVQHRRWWVRGGSVHVPWSLIAGYEKGRVPGGRQLPKVNLLLRRPVNPGRRPTWLHALRDRTGYRLQIPWTARDRVLRALRFARPDLDRTTG